MHCRLVVTNIYGAAARNRTQCWSRQQDSNPRHPLYKRGILPTELYRHELSYGNWHIELHTYQSLSSLWQINCIAIYASAAIGAATEIRTLFLGLEGRRFARKALAAYGTHFLGWVRRVVSLYMDIREANPSSWRPQLRLGATSPCGT